MQMQCKMCSVMYMSTLVLHFHPTCSRKQSLSAKNCKVSSIFQAAAPPMREPDFLNVVMALHERKLLPAIFFVFSRHRCSQYAGAVRRQLVTNAERAEIDAELREFVAAQSEAVPAGQTDALLNGAASHHAGYLPGAAIKAIGLCAPWFFGVQGTAWHAKDAIQCAGIVQLCLLHGIALLQGGRGWWRDCFSEA